MPVEFTITDVTSGTPSTIEEPFNQTDSTEYSFTILNSGNATATNCAFYLKELDYEGELEYPSSVGVVTDWYDILAWGESGVPTEGFFLTQGVDTERFSLTNGASIFSSVPLTIGTGTNNDEIEPGDSVTVTVNVTPPAGSSPRRLYYSLEMYYE